MALQLSYTAVTGITSPEAYVMIHRFEGIKQYIKVTVLIFNNKDARNNYKAVIGQVEAKLVLENGASFEQMYDVLKTLPEFVGAVDC